MSIGIASMRFSLVSPVSVLTNLRQLATYAAWS
jgi:hypothetical protein